MAFGHKVASLFRRPRPVTREEAAEIADWVNEGGAADPGGPPPLIDDENRTKRESVATPSAVDRAKGMERPT